MTDTEKLNGDTGEVNGIANDVPNNEETVKIKNEDKDADTDQKENIEDLGPSKTAASDAMETDADTVTTDDDDKSLSKSVKGTRGRSPRGVKRRATSSLSQVSEDGEDFKGFSEPPASNASKLLTEIIVNLEAVTPKSEDRPIFTKLNRKESTPKGQNTTAGTDSPARPSSGLSQGSEDLHASGGGSLLEVRVINSATSSPVPGRSNRKSIVDLSNPLLRVPLEQGWKRELVYRAALDANSRRTGDIYYYTPKGKKLRSSREVGEHLSGTGLTLENFSFFKEALGIDDPTKEIIRDAKAPRGSPAASATPGWTASAVVATPRSEGKRTPKPKPPKGASPEYPRSSQKNRTPKLQMTAVLDKAKSLDNIPTGDSPKGKPSRKSSIISKSAKVNSGYALDRSASSSTQLYLIRNPEGVYGVRPPPPLKHMTELQKKPMSPEAMVGLAQCSVNCPGEEGTVPHLQCKVCLCLFHPSCGGCSTDNTDGFICKSCLPLGSAASCITPPPPLIHMSALKAQPQVAPLKRIQPELATSKRKILMNVQSKSGTNAWSVQNVHRITAENRANIMSMAQSISVIGGRKFIIVPKSRVSSPGFKPNAPKANAPKANAPKGSTPQVNMPEANAPKGSAPQANAPKANAPAVNAPKGSAPQANAPKANAPAVNAPKGSAPQANAPEDNAPKANAPQANTPEANVPEANAPEANMPETNAPEANAPQTNTPEANAPEANVPKQAESPPNAPSGTAPEPEGVAPAVTEPPEPDPGTNPVSIKIENDNDSTEPFDDGEDPDDSEVDTPRRGSSRNQTKETPTKDLTKEKNETTKSKSRGTSDKNDTSKTSKADTAKGKTKDDKKKLNTSISEKTASATKSSASSRGKTKASAAGGGEDHFTKFYEISNEKGYKCVEKIFQYLKMRELAEASRVCTLWNRIVNRPSLWKHIRMKNSQVSSWRSLCAVLRRHGTVILDLRKMLLPQACQAPVIVDETFWREFIRYIPEVTTLERLELCRCPAFVVEEICKSSMNLKAFNALSLQCEEFDPSHLDKLSNLEELRLKSQTGFSLMSDLTTLGSLTKLKHLSLTSIKDLGSARCEAVGQLLLLESAELGECSLLGAQFGAVLAGLPRLRRLRLERGASSARLLRLLGAAPHLRQLELVNFDVKADFDDALAACTNLRRLLLIPTYVSQSATTNRQVLSGLLRLKDTLTHLMWGVTIELLRVTELFIDQCEQQNSEKKNKINYQGDCIPVIKPVPGYTSMVNEDGTYFDGTPTVPGPPQVEILPLPVLRKLLAQSLPKTKLKVLKIPFHATWRQTLADFQ